jgi:hypothetical protein
LCARAIGNWVGWGGKESPSLVKINGTWLINYPVHPPSPPSLPRSIPHNSDKAQQNHAIDLFGARRANAHHQLDMAKSGQQIGRMEAVAPVGFIAAIRSRCHPGGAVRMHSAA